MALTDYTDLVTAQHQDKPRFMASLASIVQPLVDLQAAVLSIPVAYDLDTATGSQLDVVGQWVGRSRYLTTPLTGVYFSFDTAGLGFEEGTIQGPYDPTTGQTALADDAYRTLLRATIAANQWDGTIPGAYAAWGIVFRDAGYQILIEDRQDMTMEIGLYGAIPDAVTLALMEGGYLSLRPAGVRVSFYATPTIPDAPLFGFDVASPYIAGFDAGAVATITAGA